MMVPMTQMFCTDEDPSSHLQLDASEHGGNHGAFILEDSRVQFIPKIPRDKHHERDHSFSSSGAAKDNV
jgi:hypothetical protein